MVIRIATNYPLYATTAQQTTANDSKRMNFRNSDQIPAQWEPCLCHVRTPKEAEWHVLYYHPRKKWCFKEGLELSPSHKVVQWMEVNILVRKEIPDQPSADW